MPRFYLCDDLDLIFVRLFRHGVFQPEIESQPFLLTVNGQLQNFLFAFLAGEFSAEVLIFYTRVAVITCEIVLWAKKPPSKPYPEELKTLGDHLRKKWLELKMLQKEVAERLGTTVCTVRNWEKNRSNPSLVFIPKIIRFLGYMPYDTSNQDFGRQIAAKRTFLGLRQKDLAQAIGVDPSIIRSWEKGEHKPSKLLPRLLAAFFAHSRLQRNA
jgi:transcriptional regulator with XRE-family HTH domain